MFDAVPRPIREGLWLSRHLAARWLAAQGAIESPHVLLQDQLRALTITHVIDVGANDGQYGRLLRRLGFRGRVISFEPVQEPYQRLDAAARRDGNWEAHHCALGNRDGEVTINVMKEDVFSSLLGPSSRGRDLFPGSTIVTSTERVRVRRLASVIPEVVPNSEWDRTHVKCDTQGSDLRVLEGLGSLLGALPSLQVELSLVSIYEGQPPYQEMLQFLNDHGFQLTGFFPVARDNSLRILEADAVLRRSDRVQGRGT